MTKFVPDEHFAEDRLRKLKEARERDINPYPPRAERDMEIGEFADTYGDLEKEELSSVDDQLTLVGRIDRFNDIGGIVFSDIVDETGSIQLYFEESQTDSYDELELLDKSDYISATGTPIRTNRGELSLSVERYDVLTKALRHPPSYDGLNEKSRVQERAIALRDPELRENIDLRFEMMRETRNFLDKSGYVEAETPVFHNIYGGASATPFTTYCEAVDRDVYLRIATELHLKRLLVGGYESVYEIGRVFRNEDIDTTHNPEFTMLELYRAYADYEDMMDLTENLVSHLIEKLLDGEYQIEFGDEVIDYSTPWRRVTMRDAIKEYAGIDVRKLSDEELKETALEHGGDFPGGFSRGVGIMELYEETVEGELVDPTFVVEHPKETSPLCKSVDGNPDMAERFELVVGGAELANAYTELNNPIEQGERFAEQLKQYERGEEEAHQMDEDFVEDLAYGMPPAGGLGIGMDRLAMLLTGSVSIKDVLPFPMVAPKNK